MPPHFLPAPGMADGDRRQRVGIAMQLCPGGRGNTKIRNAASLQSARRGDVASTTSSQMQPLDEVTWRLTRWPSGRPGSGGARETEWLWVQKYA